MQQSEIDAQERLEKIEAAARRAEELVKYLELNLKTIQEAASKVEANAPVDLTELKAELAKMGETVSEARAFVADVEALKANFDTLTKQVGDHDNAISSMNEKISELSDKIVTALNPVTTPQV